MQLPPLLPDPRHKPTEHAQNMSGEDKLTCSSATEHLCVSDVHRSIMDVRWRFNGSCSLHGAETAEWKRCSGFLCHFLKMCNIWNQRRTEVINQDVGLKKKEFSLVLRMFNYTSIMKARNIHINLFCGCFCRTCSVSSELTGYEFIIRTLWEPEDGN